MRTSARGHVSLIALLVACGPRAGTDEGDGAAGGTAGEASSAGSTATDPGMTSAVDSASTGAPAALPDGCSCREAAEDPFTCDDLATSACDGPELCPDVIGTCARPSADLYACTSELAYDDEAVTCALEALRDRPSGKLAFDVENETCGLEGCGSDRTELTLVADDRVVVRRCASSPLWAESSSSFIDTLAEPAYFDECLTLATTRERYECMVAGITRGADVCE